MLYTTHFLILILPLVCALLAVAFYTLLERKLLGYIMLRKGPNKVGFMGILQPFSDAGKLFCKEVVVPRYANFIPFILCPTFVLGISLTLWVMYPFKNSELIFVCGLVQFLVISSMSVYGTMVAGWSSNSKYALLGAVRSVAQSISYEVPMSFIILCFIYGSSSFMLQEIGMFQHVIMFFFPFFPCCVLWVICILAETNRAPFDFVEGESELVSGFNVEYSGGAFAMIYMAEYSSMLFNSVISSVLFFGSNEIFMSIMCMFFVVGFVWVRGTMPRMRYDKLMKLCWTVILCVAMCVACVVMCYSFL
uniref:NADH-ubiquinone oxidoreductase chain 1 n=1 Tax=Septifer bilocularis TaxID=102393 RepID=A0A516EZL3_9BIVA|nr:NADH dehydrogenase subunit 1 [Septifer bilocularis]QDO71942.1 NADH dehydrogenase subunit 1 [Septifer bilocularis]